MSQRRISPGGSRRRGSAHRFRELGIRQGESIMKCLVQGLLMGLGSGRGDFRFGGQFASPIRLHPENPHYFQWRGKAVALITSAEHYGAVLNLDFDWQRYLETLQRDGMNYTRVFSGSYVEPVGAFGIQRNTLAPATGRFLAPWARSEHARLCRRRQQVRPRPVQS